MSSIATSRGEGKTFLVRLKIRVDVPSAVPGDDPWHRRRDRHPLAKSVWRDMSVMCSSKRDRPSGGAIVFAARCAGSL
jgi:hypothetical protein